MIGEDEDNSDSEDSETEIEHKSYTLEELLANDELFVDYFNIFLHLPSFPQAVHYNQATGFFELCNEKTKKRKALDKAQSLRWINSERLPAFLASDLYHEYRLARLLSQATASVHTAPHRLTSVVCSPAVRDIIRTDDISADYGQQLSGQRRTRHKCTRHEFCAGCELCAEDFVEMDPRISDYSTTDRVNQTDRLVHNRDGAIEYAESLGKMGSVNGSDANASEKDSKRDVASDGMFRIGRAETVEDFLKTEANEEDSSANFSDEDSSQLTSVGLFTDATHVPLPVGLLQIQEEQRAFNLPYSPNMRNSSQELTKDLRDSTPFFHSQNDGGATSPKVKVRVEVCVEFDEEVPMDLRRVSYETTSKLASEANVIEKSGRFNESWTDQRSTASAGRPTPPQTSQHPLSVTIRSGTLFPTHPGCTPYTPCDIPPSNRTPFLSRRSDVSSVEIAQGFTTGQIRVGVEDSHSIGNNTARAESSNLEGGELSAGGVLHGGSAVSGGLSSAGGLSVLIGGGSLTRLAGVEGFKKFLQGTAGERVWSLWMDMERAKVIDDTTDLANHIVGMRQRYLSACSKFLLPQDCLRGLDLLEPGRWTLGHLTEVQPMAAKPLLHYWVPRYILMERRRSEKNLGGSEQYRQYLAQKNLRPESYPHYPVPPTPLPHRPKSCWAPRPGEALMGAPGGLEKTSGVYGSVKGALTGLQRPTQPSAQLLNGASLQKAKIISETGELVSMPHTPPCDPEGGGGAQSSLSAHVRAMRRVQALGGSYGSQVSGFSRPSHRGARHTTPAKEDSSDSTDISLNEIYSANHASESHTLRTNHDHDLTRISTNQTRESTQVTPPTGSRWKRNSSTLKHPPQPRGSSSITKNGAQGKNQREKADRGYREADYMRGKADRGVAQWRSAREVDRLLLALASEGMAGRCFRKYVQQSGNQLWTNSLKFWESCQEYHAVFYKRSLDTFLLQKTAKYIYALYLSPAASLPLDVSLATTDEVRRTLDPAYEELFDRIEERVIRTLLEVWSRAVASDRSTLSKIPREEDSDLLLEGNSEYHRLKGFLGAAGARRHRRGSGSSDSVSLVDSNGVPLAEGEDALTSGDSTHIDLADYTLNKVLRRAGPELDHFRSFLAAQGASLDLLCWSDIEAWRGEKDEGAREAKAEDIKDVYLNEEYFFGPHSPAGKQGQQRVLAAGGGLGRIADLRPTELCLLEAQRLVQQRLEYKWLPLFVKSDEFQRRHRELQPQRPASSLSDVMDDVIKQHKAKNHAGRQQGWDRKYVPSQEKILALRRALADPMTSAQFSRYVAVKGDFLENNVFFWQEIQKCKDISHMHSDKSLILQKIAAVIRRFIESTIPPLVQISIDADMADKIVENRHDPSPYIFRDAQAKVFLDLLPWWDDFIAFRDKLNLSDEELLALLERRKKKAKLMEIKRARMLDELTAKERDHKKLSADDARSTSDAASTSSRLNEAHLKGLRPYYWSYSQYLRALGRENALNEARQVALAAAALGQVGKGGGGALGAAGRGAAGGGKLLGVDEDDLLAEDDDRASSSVIVELPADKHRPKTLSESLRTASNPELVLEEWDRRASINSRRSALDMKPRKSVRLGLLVAA